MPGIGRPRWRVELLRVRGGMPGSWDVEVADATGHVSSFCRTGRSTGCAGSARACAAGRLTESLRAAPADEPRLRARSIAAGGRRLLAALNPAAAAAGLAPGMPLADALSFLPGLATAQAEPAADMAALTRLAEWCGRYSPWTAPDGTDGIKIEITGCGHLWGGEAALAADLARRLVRGRASPTASRSPARSAPPGPWRASRPTTAGRHCRRRKTSGRRWRRCRSRRCGSIRPPWPGCAGSGCAGSASSTRCRATRSPADSAKRWRTRLDQTLGDMPEPLSPLGEAPVRRVRLSFAEPIADPADLVRAIERLTQDLVARLAREGPGRAPPRSRLSPGRRPGRAYPHRHRPAEPRPAPSRRPARRRSSRRSIPGSGSRT